MTVSCAALHEVSIGRPRSTAAVLRVGESLEPHPKPCGLCYCVVTVRLACVSSL